MNKKFLALALSSSLLLSSSAFSLSLANAKNVVQSTVKSTANFVLDKKFVAGASFGVLAVLAGNYGYKQYLAKKAAHTSETPSASSN